MSLADELSKDINVNIYRQRTPEQEHSGWGYALNNLMRSGIGNLLGGGIFGSGIFGGRYPQESFAPLENGDANYNNPNKGLLGVGANFLADMIWGNKYDKF